ncbi:MAG: three-Cys-motif partner protein TcmP [Planctomycetota bacterium]
MVSDFFQKKRPWSKYKDFLLRNYIEPYIPKVASLKKPIVIVDCFAGCGRFEDGEPGSPIIIAEAIKRWREKNVVITGEFIEAIDENFDKLSDALLSYKDYCRLRKGVFEDHLPEMAQRAQQNTVFLYVDPYSVKGLIFERMKRVYDHIRTSSSSVEVLLNFNVAIFMRWALAALQRHSEIPEDGGEIEGLADDPCESVEIQTLNKIAGGDYWISIAENEQLGFSEKLDSFVAEYVERMLGAFRFVCTYWVKDKYHHEVPKYVLIFATRSPHGVELMNDFMCKAKREFLEKHFSKNRLFDCTPDDERIDLRQVRNDIVAVLEQSDRPLTRKEVRIEIFLTGYFAKILGKEVNAEITSLLKSHSIFSKTGRTRINDRVLLSKHPFRND